MRAHTYALTHACTRLKKNIYNIISNINFFQQTHNLIIPLSNTFQ